MTEGDTSTEPGRSGRRRLWASAAAGLAGVSFIAASMTWSEGRSPEDERPQDTVSTAPAGSTSEAGASVSPRTRTSSPKPTALPAAGAPQRVAIDSLGIDAPVLSITSEGRSLDPPPDPQDLGWWSQGARPGAAWGSALITGHTVHDGGGALDDLETIRPGTEIRVRTSQGMIRYVAASVAVLDKDTIARRAPQLFSQEVRGRLVLVTCEGWDGTGYRSNVVVTATPRT